jgi:hypothetical protein
MPIAILEKFVYTIPVVVLYLREQVHPKVVPSSLVDPLFGILSSWPISTCATPGGE